MDIAGHILKKGHVKFEPIAKKYPAIDLSLSNITYSKKWNRSVISSWKADQRILLKENPSFRGVIFKKPRKCLKFNCEFMCDSPLDLFWTHPSEAHQDKLIDLFFHFSYVRCTKQSVFLQTKLLKKYCQLMQK